METPLRLSASTVIVFDTNVLISTFVFPGFAAKVYDYCALRFNLYTSNWILSEFEEKLTTKFGYSVDRRVRLLDILRERHTVVSPTNEIPTSCRDIDDNNVLRTALFVNVDLLITGDRDLLDLVKVQTTEIVNPSAFFERFIQ